MSSTPVNQGQPGWEPPAPGDWDYRSFGPIPLDQFGAELLALYVPPLRAKNTFSKMRQTLEIVQRLAGPGATTADLTPVLVSRLIDERGEGQGDRTIHTILSYLRSACNYAKSRGYVRSTPFEFRRKWIRPGRPEGKRHYSLEEIGRVLELLAKEAHEREGWPGWRARRLRAIVSLFAYTGLRRDEGLKLRVEDVDLEGRMIFLKEYRNRKLKTEASAQPVPIPAALAPVLADWMERLPEECPFLFPGVTFKGPWTAGPAGHKPLDQLKAAGERAGVQGLTFLSLRHSFATHGEKWGLSAEMLKRVLRHTSLITQGHYRHPDLDNMRSAVDGIGFGPAPAGPQSPDEKGGAGDAS